MENIEGKTLYDIWYKLSLDERKEIVKKIVEIVKSFHLIKVEEYDFVIFIKNEINSLLIEYNIDNKDFVKLLNLCDIYFKDNIFGLIHNDLHFDNFIFKNNEGKLIDFERSIPAPIDYEFKLFDYCKEKPWKWASAVADLLSLEEDYQDLMNMVIDNYYELKNVLYLNERLLVYRIIEDLKEYKHTSDVEVLEKIKTRIKEEF